MNNIKINSFNHDDSDNILIISNEHGITVNFQKI